MRRLLLSAVLLAAPAWAADCPDLTTLQRAAGLVTWQNFVQLSAIGLGVAGALFFCSGLIRRFLQQVRLVEVLLWSASVAAIAGGAFVPAGYELWPVLSGCLLLPGALALSLWRRKVAPTMPKIWAGLGLVWAAVAIAYQLPAVGFLAVLALLSWLGLMFAVGPGWYGFGFGSREAVLRGTLAGAIVAIGYSIVAASSADVGPFAVFRAGALWLGGFTWYLGLLILSARWRMAGNYLTLQALALVSMAGSLTAGLLFDIREITVMSSTFLMFYVAGKVIEIPVSGRIGFGLKLLAAAGLMSSLWYFAKDWSLPL